MGDGGQALARVTTLPITERMRGEYDPGQMELIRATVAKDCNTAELGMFLEVCARYELDPFSKQIWAAKIAGKLQIFMSRDGLLALANRSPDFRGCESDVVREHDTFRKYRDADRGQVVEHDYVGTAEARGKILGAWALVHRAGHMPTYFFAEWGTYAGQNVWKSHPEAMIVKCAEGMALRKAFSISGVVAEGEVDARQSLTQGSEGGSPDIEWGDDPELESQLRDAFSALGYRRAKMRLLLAGKTDDERRALLAELHAEADRFAQADERGEDGAPPPEVVDADVVDDVPDEPDEPGNAQDPAVAAGGEGE